MVLGPSLGTLEPGLLLQAHFLPDDALDESAASGRIVEESRMRVPTAPSAPALAAAVKV
jgi:hypothetical protein